MCGPMKHLTNTNDIKQQTEWQTTSRLPPFQLHYSTQNYLSLEGRNVPFVGHRLILEGHSKPLC